MSEPFWGWTRTTFQRYGILADAGNGANQKLKTSVKKRNLMTPGFQIWWDVRKDDLKDARQLKKENPSM
jgi:hypothetical protein